MCIAYGSYNFDADTIGREGARKTRSELVVESEECLHLDTGRLLMQGRHGYVEVVFNTIMHDNYGNTRVRIIQYYTKW